MKLAAAFLLSVFAVSYAEPDQRGIIIEAILKKVLEDLRPKLKSLEIPRQDHGIDESFLRFRFVFENGLVEGLDRFVVANLKATLLPLRLSNLTLTWNDVEFTGEYNLMAEITVPGIPGLMKIHGDGNATVVLRNMFFTIGSNFEYVDGKLHIPPGGLYGFDFNLGSCKVQLDNLLDGGEKGETVNKYISFLVPELVRDYKYDFFEYVREPLRLYINGYLAGNNMKPLLQ